MVSEGRRKGILIVDDSEADIELMKELFAAKDPNIVVRGAMNADEAQKMIETSQGNATMPNIDLVIVDMHMPRNDGIAVLRRVKSDPNLKTVPVVVFSGSESQDDIDKAYELGANSYVVKPVAFEELSKAVGSIDAFWLKTACLPPQA